MGCSMTRPLIYQHANEHFEAYLNEARYRLDLPHETSPIREPTAFSERSGLGLMYKTRSTSPVFTGDTVCNFRARLDRGKA